MPDLTIWVSGADFIKIKSFLALEGSNFLKLFWLKSIEIRYFSRQQDVVIWGGGDPPPPISQLPN